MLNARGDNDAIWAHVGREHVASCHREDYKWDCNFAHASSNDGAAGKVGRTSETHKAPTPLNVEK